MTNLRWFHCSRRGLDKSLIAQLANGTWIHDGLNVLITGPTGVGKTWIACALAHKACRDGYNVAYHRLPRLLEELTISHGDGRFAKLMRAFARTDLIVLDDWGLAKLTDPQRRDLLELIDDRHGQAATIVTSQLPVEHWHDVIGDPTLADAILDRLVHNAYRIVLKGESMRKRLRQFVSISTTRYSMYGMRADFEKNKALSVLYPLNKKETVYSAQTCHPFHLKAATDSA